MVYLQPVKVWKCEPVIKSEKEKLCKLLLAFTDSSSINLC